MILRNVLYIYTIVPMNFAAGAAIFALVLLWAAYRQERERFAA